MFRIPRAILSLALALAPAAASAAGLGIPDLSTAGLSEGGATIASPDGPAGLYFNPAALARQEGLRAQLDARATRVFLTFQRLGASGEDLGFAKVDSGGAFSVTPFVGVAYRLKTPLAGIPIVIAGGGHPLNGYTGYRYPNPTEVREQVKKEAPAGTDSNAIESDVALRTPQRYTSISSDSAIFMPVVAVAAQLSERLSVGFTLQSPIAVISQSQAVYAGVSAGEDTNFDAILKIKAAGWTMSGVLGAQGTLPGGLLVGAAVQLPIHFKVDGTLDADIPPSLQGQASLVGKKTATVDLTFPWVARLGVRLVRPAFEVELAGTYEAWHQQKTITLTPHDTAVSFGGKETPLPEFLIQKNLNDAGSVRLGGEWHPGAVWESLAWLKIRAGVIAETSAVPENRQSLDSPGWERLGTSIGFAARVGRYDLAAGYLHFFAPARKVRDSQIRQLVAFQNVEPQVVGNGDYTSQVDVAGLTIAGSWE